MADVAQLETALRNADAAGDVEAARALAAEVMKSRESSRGALDKLTGTGGPRYQTWPERLVRGAGEAVKSAATLPGDIVKEAQQPAPNQISDSDVSTAGVGRVLDLAAIASPVNPMVRSGDNAVASGILRRGTPAAPTRQTLEQSAEHGYKTAREIPLDIKSSSVSGMAEKVGANLEREGFNAELAPNTFSIIKKMQSAPEGSVATLGNLDTIRKTLGNAAGNFANPTEQKAASKAIRFLDDYLENIPKGDVLAGDAATASKVIGEARGDYAAAKRSAKITDAVEAADISSAAANSGQNIGNATRQRIKSLLLSDKNSRGFSPEELAQMETVVRGTKGGNVARIAGNLLGGGGGLGAGTAAAITGAGAAAATGNPALGLVGAAAPIVGSLLKKSSDASVSRQIKILDDMIRARSPLMGRTSGAVISGVDPSKAAIMKALMGMEAGQQ